jgi:hypothetical protein
VSPGRAGLVVSCLAAAEPPRTRALAALAERFGPLAWLSRPLAFEPDYYRPEMGGPLTRRLALMERLVPEHGLAAAKAACREIEAGLAAGGRRRVNLDPGLLSAGSLALATTKPQAHRVALAPGLYAEVTLWYHRGGFRALPWTYPDYAGRELGELLEQMRARVLWRARADAEGGANP